MLNRLSNKSVNVDLVRVGSPLSAAAVAVEAAEVVRCVLKTLTVPSFSAACFCCHCGVLH